MSPDFGNPDEHITNDVADRCEFCKAEMPAEWDAAGWRDVSKRRDTFSVFCCGPCYVEHVEDGSGMYDPSDESISERADRLQVVPR